MKKALLAIIVLAAVAATSSAVCAQTTSATNSSIASQEDTTSYSWTVAAWGPGYYLTGSWGGTTVYQPYSYAVSTTASGVAGSQQTVEVVEEEETDVLILSRDPYDFTTYFLQ